MDWNEAAEGSPKLHEGYHRVKISKVVRTKKNDEELTNRDGVPFMLVVVEGADGAEASSSFTLDNSKAFFLGRLFKSCGMSDTFTEEGLGVSDFENEETAKRIEGCRLWVRVTHNGQYANFEALPEADVPPDVLQRAKSDRKTGKAADPAPVTAGGPVDDDDSDLPF